MTPSEISVVIPGLNEQESIGKCITSAVAAGAEDIIVVDGGSQDATIQRAQASGASQIARSAAGRGTQLNAGAQLASGEIIVFLHADNLLDPSCLQQICDWQDESSWGDPAWSEIVWGAFEQRIDSNQLCYRWLERGNAWRVKWRGAPFGDQAVFVRRKVYEEHGGFPDIPLMEDVVFAKQMRQVTWPVLLPGPVTISPRRWQEQGVIRQTFRNWKIQVAHRFGVSPERLANWYR